MNLHPADPCVWATSATFDKLLDRFGDRVHVPRAESDGWLRSVGARLLRLFQPRTPGATDYARFMERFHQYLKGNEGFQERTPKRIWRLPPGSAWLLFTDQVSHAELRGQFVLEHSYLVPEHVLEHLEWSPRARLAQRRRRGTGVASAQLIGNGS